MTFDWLSTPLIDIGSYQLSIGQIGAALIVIVAMFYLSRLVQNSITRAFSATERFNPSQIYPFTRFVHYAMVVVGFLIALSVLGIDVTKLAIVAGALGVGVGLGLQELVKNFVSGIVILLEKSLKVGDFVELEADVFGIVKEIRFRSTLIRTNDNVDIMVPNGELVTNRVTNWTLEESQARVRIPFGVAYGSDKELVKKAVLEAAGNVEYTLSTSEQQSSVWFTGFGDSSLDFVLGVWVDYEAVIRPTALKSAYLWAIDDAFRKYHIEVPFPQRDVYIKKLVDFDKSTAD